MTRERTVISQGRRTRPASAGEGRVACAIASLCQRLRCHGGVPSMRDLSSNRARVPFAAARPAAVVGAAALSSGGGSAVELEDASGDAGGGQRLLGLLALRVE